MRGSREPRAAHEALWAIVRQGFAEWTVGPPSRCPLARRHFSRFSRQAKRCLRASGRRESKDTLYGVDGVWDLASMSAMTLFFKICVVTARFPTLRSRALARIDSGIG